MSKAEELAGVRSKWDALNLAYLEHETTELAVRLVALCGGMTVPPQEARIFYATLQDILAMTLAKVQERTAKIDQYPFDWDYFIEEMGLICRDWESKS